MILFPKLWCLYRSIYYFYQKLFEIVKLRKILKGIGASAHLLIELLFVVLIVFAFGIRTSWFQTFLAQQLAAILSNGLDTEVRIDKVDIVFFDSADIHGVYVEDKIKDTLLYSESIHITTDDYNLTEGFIAIEEVTLSNANVNLKKYKNDTTFNFQHIVDYLGSSEKDTTATSDFKVTVAKLRLDEVNFVYQDQNADPTNFGLDYSNLAIKHLSGEFSEFNFKGDELGTKIEDLTFQDRSGLVLSKFSSKVFYSPRVIALNTLEIGLNNSLLVSDSLKLKSLNGTDDFADFVHQVIFEGNLRDTKVDLKDVSFFAPAIEGMDAIVNIKNIELSGPVFGMQLQDTDIRLLRNTKIVGDFEIPDLDHPDSLIFRNEIALFQTSISDIQRLKLTPFLDGQDYVKLPDNLNGAGLITVRDAYFNGSLEKFEVDADIVSGLGSLTTENGLVFEKKGDGLYHYNGGKVDGIYNDIRVDKLDLATITGNDLLGITTGYLSINEGSRGLNMDDLDLRFTGRFNEFELNDYVYNDIKIKKGRFKQNRFNGEITVDDNNIALVYKGEVDLNNEMAFDFTVGIDSARLHELNLQGSDFVKSVLNSDIDVSIKGTSLERIRGEVVVNNLVYKDNDRNFKMDHLAFSIKRNDHADSIKIRSELFDTDLTGKFDLLHMWPVVQHQLARIADNLIEDVDISESNNKFFKLNMNLKDVNPIMQFVDTNLFIAENSNIRSSYSLDSLKLKIIINSDSVKYQDMFFEKIILENYFDSLRARVDYTVKKIMLSDSLGVSHAAIFSYVKNNEFSTNVGWDGLGDVEPAIFVFNTHLKENKDILTEFRPSFFFLKSHKWKISPTSKLLVNNELIEFTKFDIRNGDHLVNLEGKVSKDPKDWLLFTINDFDLTDLNGVLGGAIEIGGTLNVDGGVADVYNNIRFISLSDIKEFIIDGELVGDLLVDNKWNKKNNSVEIKGNLKREDKETFKFFGNYFPDLKKENLDLDLTFDKTDIGFLNAFSDPALYTDIEGLLDGGLKITGELTAPVINGAIDVVSANVLVPMFNVGYGVSGKMKFSPKGIKVDNMDIYDQEGNRGLVKINLSHKDWADWQYQVNLIMGKPTNLKRFLVMNTYYNDGDLYYGRAYITGDVSVVGGADLTTITVNANTQTGTDLKLAMYGAGDLEESSFIVFDTIVPNYSINETDDEVVHIETTGLVMNMNFNISKETKATIIFDPIFEDQIEVTQGEGNLALNMDEYGDMAMFGKYTILEGKYDMRVKGLVSKDFGIRSGSEMVWSGSPYDAIIDIKADYQTNISLDPILPPGIEDQSNNKEQVIATMVMARTLMNPDIGFKISAPTANDIGKTALQSIQADQDHLNKQFFAVLALNKFLPVNGGAGSSGSAAFDFAESQINDILDKFDEGLGVGLNDIATTLNYETNLGERLTVKTSLGVVANGDEESTSTTGIIGDVEVEYKLNEDGTFTVNAFNESNQGTDAEKGPFTQGVGFHYQEEFNTSREFKLLQGFLNIFRKKENDVDYKSNKANGKKVPVPR